MTQKFALFPLQLVVFPGETLNLHIFEPRYRQLVDDAVANDMSWLIPSVIEGVIRPVATEVRLTEVVNRYPTGESDIRTVGGAIHFVEEFWKVYPDRLYPGGAARPVVTEEKEDPTANAEIVALTRKIYRALNIDKEILEADAGFRTYQIGHYVGLTLEQEYELLTLRKSRDRQEYLVNHLRDIAPDAEINTSMKARARLNGHFQQLQPPDW